MMIKKTKEWKEIFYFTTHSTHFKKTEEQQKTYIILWYHVNNSTYTMLTYTLKIVKYSYKLISPLSTYWFLKLLVSYF